MKQVGGAWQIGVVVANKDLNIGKGIQIVLRRYIVVGIYLGMGMRQGKMI